jgi:hypothetical protein
MADQSEPWAGVWFSACQQNLTGVTIADLRMSLVTFAAGT